MVLVIKAREKEKKESKISNDILRLPKIIFTNGCGYYRIITIIREDAAHNRLWCVDIIADFVTESLIADRGLDLRDVLFVLGDLFLDIHRDDTLHQTPASKGLGQEQIQNPFHHRHRVGHLEDSPHGPVGHQRICPLELGVVERGRVRGREDVVECRREVHAPPLKDSLVHGRQVLHLLILLECAEQTGDSTGLEKLCFNFLEVLVQLFHLLGHLLVKLNLLRNAVLVESGAYLDIFLFFGRQVDGVFAQKVDKQIAGRNFGSGLDKAVEVASETDSVLLASGFGAG